jgi:hypothetical protein
MTIPIKGHEAFAMDRINMNNESEFLSHEEKKTFFDASIETTWERCFTVWCQDGRVEDFPHA